MASENIDTISVSLSNVTFANLNTVFSGEQCMANWKEIIDAHSARYWRSLDMILRERAEFAISGAMRWPWSQEARVGVSIGVVVD